MIPDYDSPWKDLLDRFFEAFIEFFFPSAHAQIDWAGGFEFLDKELQKITADAALGRRAVDKLVKVRLKTGADLVALIHTEAQGEREPDFEERIYIYHFRISDRFNKRVATFVILTDSSRGWRPSRFRYELLGTKVSLQFSSVKLLDYRDKWNDLEQSQNPFAVVVMAHLRTLETRRDARQRLEWKLTLTKMLYERGYDERTVIDLFRFLDWLMFLPENLQREYRVEIERYEEERRMPYVTTIEKMGIEQGRAEGWKQASLEIALSLLRQKFGDIDQKTESGISDLTQEQLRRLTDTLLKLESLDELHGWLETIKQ